MAVYYKLYQEKREGAKYENKWYARAKIVGHMDLHDVALKIQENTTAKEADAWAVLVELVNVLREALSSSKSVKIDGLGTFSPAISTSPAESAAAFTAAANVRGMKVNFLPEMRYENGVGKGKRKTNMLLRGAQVRELPKNDVDTSKP